MKTFKLFFTFLFILTIFVTTALSGERYSVATGTWDATSTWSLTRGGAPGASAPSVTDTVWITNGTVVTLTASGKNCYNLIVENGGTLTADYYNPTSSQRYVRVSGDFVQNDGLIGRHPDSVGVYSALGFETYVTGKSVTFKGIGSTFISRIRPGSSALNTTAIIDHDMTLTYAGTSGTGGMVWYAIGDGSALTVNAGKTLTLLNYGYIGTASSAGSSGNTTTITIDGTLDMSAPNCQLTLRALSGKIVTLTVNGTVNVGKSFYPTGDDPSTIVVNSGGELKVGSAGDGGVADFTHSAQTVTGAGTFTLLPGVSLNVGSTAGLDPINGPIRTTTRNFSNGAGYIYNGTAAQITGSDLPLTVSELEINNANGLTLSGNLTVNDTLTLVSGKIVTSVNELTLGENGYVDRTSGYIVGNFKKHIPLGATAKTFEIGDASYYTPVDVAFGNVTTAGYLSASTITGEHPQIASAGLNENKNVNRYYTLTNSGVTFDNYSAIFNFDVNDIDVGANPSNFIVKKYDNPTWSSTTIGTRTGTSTEAVGLTSFSDFAIGEEYIAGAPAIDITGLLVDFGAVVVGNTSAEQNYSVSGSNLTDNISITAPAGFEISTTSGSGFGSSVILTQSGGSVPSTPIYVRFAPTSTGSASGNITHASAGASTQNQAVSGTGIENEPTVQASGLLFSSVTSDAMSLTWTNGNGANRIVVAKAGSAVDSDPADGVTYAASSVFSSGTQIGTGNYVIYSGTGNSVDITGLSGNTTYHFAVYEYNGSGGTENYLIPGAVGNQTTLLGAIVSAQTGNWSSGTTWVGGVVPGVTDDVLIANGHTVSLDGANSWTIKNLTIGQGTSGILNYASDVTAANSLTINGDLILAAGSQYVLGSLPSVEPKLYVNGNISVGNGAKLDQGSGSTKGVVINFTKSTAGDQAITQTGTPVIIQFNKVVVDRPNITDRVVANCNVKLKGSNAVITLTKGTWEQTSGTLEQTTTSATNVNLGTVNGVLKISGDANFLCTSSIVGPTGSNGSDAVIVINTTGTFTVGSMSNQARLQNSNTLDIISGTINIGGRLTISSPANISGGNINIDPQGSFTALAGSSSAFEVTSAGSLTMSNGTITVVDPILATGAGLEVKLSTSATYNITGGTIRLGDGVSTTAGADGYQVSTHSVPLWNLEINGDNAIPGRAVTLTDNSAARNLVVQNNLTINSGTLNANYGTGSNITLGGTFTNNGTFNGSDAATYTFNGSAAQITNILPATVGNLALNNSAGISITNPVIVTGTLTLGGNNSFTNLSTVTGYSGLTYSANVPQTTGSELGSSITNLRINNENGVTLGNSTTVNGTFTLSNGNLLTGVNELTIDETGSVSRTSGHVVGNFKKHIPLGAASKTFEIGDATYYTPVSVAFGDVTTTGYLFAKVMVSDHPQIATSGLDPSKTVNRYYSLTNSGILFNTCDATFNFVPEDLDPGTNPADFIVKKFDTGTWSTPTTANPLATSIQATGLTSFSDFAIGNTVLPIQSNGTGGGVWSDITTWQGGVVPTVADNVVILGTDSVAVTAAASCNDLTVQSGGKIALTALLTANSLALQANSIFYNGSSSPSLVGSTAAYSLDNASTVVHSGSGTLGGGNNLTFGNLVIQRTSGTVAGGNLIINGDFTINNNSATTVFRGSNTSVGSLTHTIHGNVYINLGTLSCIDNASTTGIWNIDGNVYVTGTGSDARIGPISSGGSGGTGIFNINGDLIISGGRLQYATSATTSTGIFNLGGNLTMSSGALNTSGTGPFAINFVGTGTQTVTMGLNVSFNTIFSDTVKNGATVVFDNGNYTWGSGQSSGNFVVEGSIELKGNSSITGAGSFELKSGGTLKIGSAAGITSTGAVGNVQVTGIRTYISDAIYEYVGTAAQVIGDGLPLNVNNLTINNASGVTLTSSTTVNNVLTFNSGPIISGLNTLALAATGSVARVSGHVVGNFQKHVASGATTKTFEVGDAASYTPIEVSFANVTTPGDLTASVMNSDHSQINSSGINPLKSVNRYYTLNNGGVVFDQYDAVFNFVSDDIDAGANTDNFIVEQFDGLNWASTTVGTRTATSTQVTGLTSFSDFAIGEVLTYTLDVTIVGNGTVVKDPDLTSYAPGASVQLSATAEAGWIFDGWTGDVTSTDNPLTIVMDGNKDVIANFTLGFGSISGTLFNDLNGNGVKDDGELGLAGWDVAISSVSVNETIQTDIDGNYYFGDLPPGDYMITQTVQDGWVQTAPLSPDYYMLPLTGGDNLTGKDFGNFQLAVISGIVFRDLDRNGYFNPGEPGLTDITVNLVATNPANDQTILSGVDGEFEFKAVLDNYTLSIVIPGGRYLTVPVSESYDVEVTESGMTFTYRDFGLSANDDFIKYRSFLQEDIVAVDLKGKLPKAAKRKPIGGYWEFTLVYPDTLAEPANQLHIQFKNDVDPVRGVVEYSPFATVTGDTKKKFDFSDGVVNPGDTVMIKGYSKKGKPQQIKKYWFGPITKIPSAINMLPTHEYLELPMPTYANLIYEVYNDGVFTSTGGLVVGTPQPDSTKKLYGWVVLKKDKDIQKTLRDKTGIHEGDAGFFDFFSHNGKPLVKEQKTLPPKKHNNKLFAEIVALKLGIAASMTEHTRLGFGELIYSDTSNVLNGKMIKEIADIASAAMTSKEETQEDAENYYYVIRRINEAFAGPIDTVSFAAKTYLTGIVKLSDVPYLLSNPDVPKAVITPSDRKYVEMPEVFELAQNYPNPFNPTTTIEFTLPLDAIVTLKVYNILGQEVATLADKEICVEGLNYVEFDASRLSSGVYFYRITAESVGDDVTNFTQVKKMMLLK